MMNSQVLFPTNSPNKPQPKPPLQPRIKKQHLLNITNNNVPRHIQEKKNFIYVPKKSSLIPETQPLTNHESNHESFVNQSATTSQPLPMELAANVEKPSRAPKIEQQAIQSLNENQECLHDKQPASQEPTAKPPKRIYTKEALLSLRNSLTPMPPPSPLPSDIMAEYNAQYDKREQDAMELLQKDMEKASIKKPYSAQAWKPKKMDKQRQNHQTQSPAYTPFQGPNSCPQPSTKKYRPPSSLLNSPAVLNNLPNINNISNNDNTIMTGIEQPEYLPTLSQSFFEMLPPPKPPASPSKKNNTKKKALPKPSPKEYSPWDHSDDDENNTNNSDGEIQWVMQELSARRLETRQRQIDIGKNTIGYQNYVKLIPPEKRKRYDPQTPNKFQVCSKRSWDGQIKKWRRLVHQYDPCFLKTQDQTGSSETLDPSDSGVVLEKSPALANSVRTPHPSSSVDLGVENTF
eukprot:TRINITY_DN3642_c0_g1_i1.p1 TRINITY_DN3642_c0_g1~~TRINITY_DN3642_c0_g1_i1.p1  ORF type:complete len:460 (+),score=120.83 TRINITY_DN3642_c0_g1_i1:82-1461(+)